MEEHRHAISASNIQNVRIHGELYAYYVGIDIGYKFHVAACVSRKEFEDPKLTWKRKKTIKINADIQGITCFLTFLKKISESEQIAAKDFFILLEPTGGNYGYVIMRALIDAGYTLFQVKNKAVKDFREETLGITEKSDEIDARIMAYMGFHKSMNPSLKSVSIVIPSTPNQLLFRVLTKDRWLLTQQLSRRKNQVLQMFAVTNPDLKAIFIKPTVASALRFALEYPNALTIKAASEDELRRALVRCGARVNAIKKARRLYEAAQNSIAMYAPHLDNRQRWLIEEVFRLQEAIDKIDLHIAELLLGDKEKNLPPHPYTEILFSLPIMGNIWGCTLIGVIGDIQRFDNARQFKKYLGVSAENAKSGISISKTRMTYNGVRDARRILFQMSLVYISSKSAPNIFRIQYKQMLEGRNGITPMPKMKAIGHISGKIAQIIYGCLKSGKKYDAGYHAAATKVKLHELHP